MPSHRGRSPTRVEFCQQVAKRAREITTTCIREQAFRACFDGTQLSGIGIRSVLNASNCTAMKELRSALSRLETTMGQFSRDCTKDPLLLVVFDEVSSLFDEGRAGRYIALNCLIGCISMNHNVWYFFLSTEPKLDQIFPHYAPQHGPTSDIPSWRGDFRIMRYPPFTKFTVDIPDIKNDLLLTPENEDMSRFASAKHMARFGRPIWSAYDRPDEIAATKIIGSNLSGSYDAFNVDQAFAVLSVRLCLDMNLANPMALTLSQTAVNVYMRMVDSVDPLTGVLFTTTPSEPILANAAMRHLCRGMAWAFSIKTFTAELLDYGVINKGRKGELYSRLILTLAHDSIAGLNAPDASFSKVLPTFTVESFLKALYAKSYHAAIDHVDRDILKARMNFLSFTSTEEYLTAESFERLCYILLRRCTVLQLAPQQNSYDHLLPFYDGDPDQPFDLTKVGAILVQVKNRKETSTVSSILREDFFSVEGLSPYKGTHQPWERRDFQHIIFDKPGVKLLFLLLDLGTDEVSVEVSYSKATNPRIWAIHSKGNDEQIFGCIDTMQASEYVHAFFRNAMPPSRARDIAVNHHKDQLYNALYHDRYSKKGSSSPPEDVEQAVDDDAFSKHQNANF
jgi:hypothetical protein